MTDLEITLLAEFMEWKPAPDFHDADGVHKSWFDEDGNQIIVWKPDEDWNQWRKVEEKVIQNVILHAKFDDVMNDKYKMSFICSADLPTRCKALISILSKDDE